jgi:hypothetical protein
MRTAHRLASGLGLLLLLPLSACNESSGLEAEVAALQARVIALEAKAASLEAKTTSFSEVTGTLSDAQVPDDITVAFALTAGDADTLDGYHANQIAESGAFTPAVGGFSFGWAPEGPFSYLRTGNRVRVTGSIQCTFGFHVVFDPIELSNLPYRSSPFTSVTDVIGTCSADLSEFVNPVPVTSSLDAIVGFPGVRISFTPLGGIVYQNGTVSVDFSYDVDP